MIVQYQPKKDIAQITFQKAVGKLTDYDGEKITVSLDNNDSPITLTLKEATALVSQLIAAGVPAPKSKQNKPSKPTWEEVDSSMINAFKYDPNTKILDVIFNRTGRYRYLDVPKKVVKGLREADSKGSYMRWAIIDMYRYEK